jgi:hypothetical protein
MLTVMALLASVVSEISADAREVPQTGVPQAATAQLARGTPVALRLISPLSSRHSEVGDRFHMALEAPIIIDGQIVVQAGARAVGEVIAVETKGLFGRPGSISVTLLHLLAGTRLVRLEGHADSVGGDPDDRAGLVVAAILLTPFVSGRSADFPPGTKLSGRVAETLTLSVAAASPPPQVLPQAPPPPQVLPLPQAQPPRQAQQRP